jgi:two-component system response regulator RegX3
VSAGAERAALRENGAGGNGMAALVLLVDDEASVRDALGAYLERAGYRVALARDGDEAAALFPTVRPDVVILDLMLPGVDGWELLRRWRSESQVPVVILTARADESDAIVGLRLGADDYVRKPFSPGEVVARLEAVRRRVHRPPEPETATVVRDELRIEPEARRAELGGVPLDLTATEFDLLLLLARHPGRVFTRDVLLGLLQGQAFAGYERSIDTHVKNLRHKLGDDADHARWIETVHGVGYRFADPQH